MLKAEKQPVRFMETWEAKATPIIDVTFKNVINSKAPVEDLKRMEKEVLMMPLLQVNNYQSGSSNMNYSCLNIFFYHSTIN